MIMNYNLGILAKEALLKINMMEPAWAVLG